jgi:mobilome CxxCx(11)CxxC protein
MAESDTLRMQCWDSAIHDFGTGYIFECRARSLRTKLRLLSFLGIIVPVFIGGIVMTYGTHFPYIDFILTIGGIFGIIQLVTSIGALVSKWDDTYAYSQESTSANYDLANRYKVLAQSPPTRLDEFRTRLEFLNAENQRRSDADYKQSITEQEKRKGLRASLRNFQRECTACHKVPTSMKPTDCDVCGNF